MDEQQEKPPRNDYRANFKAIEERWQKHWEESRLFKMDEKSTKPKYYCLNMFPYPSGTLHVGHARNYIIGDAVARYKITRGYNVLMPMGWDAFGLPAENAAIKDGIHPREHTLENIAQMKGQFSKWGVGYDWDREISTCDPSYYKWTQWIFNQLLKRDLAYRASGPVNWCPSCMTVLANEQVIEGQCERCGTRVGVKDLEQWYFRITELADRLVDDLDEMEGWSDRVKVLQENWIGRSEGAEIYFTLPETGETVACFTTRPDTVFGVTFFALAAEHPLVTRLADRHPKKDEIIDFIVKVKQQHAALRSGTGGDYEKEGMTLNAYVVNPMTGGKVPIWVVNYALMDYGTGAVMGVPAHDQRDFEFAKKAKLPIRVVINPKGKELDGETMTEAYEGDGVQTNSGAFGGLPNRFAMKKIAEEMKERGVGKESVHYRIRDWLISRQRYWGAPIPVLYCEKDGIVPVPDKELPVLLPDQVDYRPTGSSPLAANMDFLTATCPVCKGRARRETDTMDTFVDSAWYYLRFLNPRDERKPFGADIANKWLPVDRYIGGAEHATKHLIYARFITKVLYDLQMVEFEEPFANLFNQGLICKLSVKCPQCRAYVDPDEINEAPCAQCQTPGAGLCAECRNVAAGKCKACSTDVVAVIEKMSKSKGNVVSPDPILESFGADTMRLYILFIGPPEADAEWIDDGVLGPNRFLNRLWEVVSSNAERVKGAPSAPADLSKLSDAMRAARRKTHLTVKQVTETMEGDLHFNTAISHVMELVNELKGVESWDDAGTDGLAVLREGLEAAVRLLAPFVPHLSEELWTTLGHEPSIFRAPWPTFDEKALEVEQVEIVVQVNGKVRSKVTVESGLEEDAMKAVVLADEKVKKALEGATVKNVVVVPGRLVNIVVDKPEAAPAT